MLTMATPGQSSICFSCGQPLPHGLAPVGADGSEPAVAAAPLAPIAPIAPIANDAPPAFPLTGAMASPLEPPPNPYGASGATIIGASGQFAIRAGIEMSVDRDPAQCPIALTEPRMSDVHATLKFENGHCAGSRPTLTSMPARIWRMLISTTLATWTPMSRWMRMKMERSQE